MALDLVTVLARDMDRLRAQHRVMALDLVTVLARTTASVPCHHVRRHALHRVRVDQCRHPHLPSKYWQSRTRTGPLAPFFIAPCLP
jgi:hypothetical protein